MVDNYTISVGTKLNPKVKTSLEDFVRRTKEGAKGADKIRQSVERIKPRPLNNLANAAKTASGGFGNLLKNITLFGTNLQGLAVLAVNQLKREFVGLTDQYNRVIGQMEAWSGSTEKAIKLTKQLQQVSADTGWDLDAMSSTTTKLSQGLSGFGVTQEDLIKVTRGLGLQFRSLGDDGSRLPKVAGALTKLFTGATAAMEDIEGLLGRGRAEQLATKFTTELQKAGKLDVGESENALAALDRAMRAGLVSTKDMANALIGIANEGNRMSTTAKEIGHGWDQLKKAASNFLTGLDAEFGGSNTIAKWFTEASVEVQFLSTQTGEFGSIIVGVGRLLDAAFGGWIKLIKQVGEGLLWMAEVAGKEVSPSLRNLFKDNAGVIRFQTGLEQIENALFRIRNAREDFTPEEIGDIGNVATGGGGGGGRRATTTTTTTPTITPTTTPQVSAGVQAFNRLIEAQQNLTAQQVVSIDVLKKNEFGVSELDRSRAKLHDTAVQAVKDNAHELSGNKKLHDQYKGLINQNAVYAKKLEEEKKAKEKAAEATAELARKQQVLKDAAINAFNSMISHLDRALNADREQTTGQSFATSLIGIGAGAGAALIPGIGPAIAPLAAGLATTLATRVLSEERKEEKKQEATTSPVEEIENSQLNELQKINANLEKEKEIARQQLELAEQANADLRRTLEAQQAAEITATRNRYLVRNFSDQPTGTDDQVVRPQVVVNIANAFDQEDLGQLFDSESAGRAYRNNVRLYSQDIGRYVS